MFNISLVLQDDCLSGVGWLAHWLQYTSSVKNRTGMSDQGSLKSRLMLSALRPGIEK